MRYAQLHNEIWIDEKFLSLDAFSKILFIYFLSSPHSNMIGYYRAPIQYIAFDIRSDETKVKEAIDNLVKMNLIKYEFQTGTVLVNNYLKYNPIQGNNQAKGALKMAKNIPNKVFNKEFIAVVERYASQFKEVFEPIRNPSETPSKGYAESVTVAESVSGAVDEGDLPPILNDENTKRISKAYADNGFGILPTNAGQTLIDLAEEYTIEWVEMALKKAGELGKRNVRYVEGILKGWQADGQPNMEGKQKPKDRQPDYFKPLEYHYED